MPAYIPIGFLWLFIFMVVKLAIKSDKAALVMVGIPGVPLAFMAVFFIIVMIIELISGRGAVFSIWLRGLSSD